MTDRIQENLGSAGVAAAARPGAAGPLRTLRRGMLHSLRIAVRTVREGYAVGLDLRGLSGPRTRPKAIRKVLNYHWLAYAFVLIAVAGAGVPADALEAGAAKVEITPPLGTPLNGYLDRLGRGAVAVHDPLWVRCLYLDDGETRVFLINADLCIINRELRDRVLELAPPDVPRANIILTATHTHNGTGGMVESVVWRAISGPYRPDVVEFTAQKFAEAMEAAVNGKRRAAIGYGTTRQTILSRNRRVEGGPIDEQIGVVRVDDADGNAIAILANFAAHPTSVPAADGLSFSADYCGAFYTELERLSSEGCVAMFLNGAQGDQTIGNPGNRDGWARTQYVGEQLAVLVKGVANNVPTTPEAALHVATSTPELPSTLGSAFMPRQTVLKTLEIDGLLMAFFPGEPCVEIGLELRRHALSRGYEAQFSVGLANDHLMYFVPQSAYAGLSYECGFNFYGPYIEEWFYDEFARLMTKGTPPPIATEPAPAQVEDWDGGFHAAFHGTSYAMGFQRGRAFAEQLQQVYEERIVEGIRSGTLTPPEDLAPPLPPFIDFMPVYLPLAGVGARPLLAGLPSGLYREIAGVADGAGLPFDAIWLMHCLPTYDARPEADPEALYRSPFCTMVAAVGDRAGADDLLVGRNLDWPVPDQVLIEEVQPENGRRFAAVGFPWSVGAFSGMNADGLVVCVERAPGLGSPSLDGPPVEVALRDVLQNAPSVAGAVERLKLYPHLRGYHILLADASPEALVLELGASQTVRRPEEGLLLGGLPDSAGLDADGQARYRRTHRLFTEERIISPDELAAGLADREPGQTGRAQIFNDTTAHSVVFLPRSREMRVAVPGPDGHPGRYRTVRLRGAGQ